MKFQKILKMVHCVNILMGIAVLTFLALGINKACFAQETATKTSQQEGVQAPESQKNSGLAFIAAAISIGLATIGAGIAVAMVGSAAMGAICEKPDLLGKAIIFIGLAEGLVIYGLIISIMILFK